MHKSSSTSDIQLISTDIDHTTLLNYLFDIADINDVAFPRLQKSEWEELFLLTKSQKLYYYLGEWLLSRYKAYVPDTIAAAISVDLARNSARNALILKQITEIAVLFAEAGIPLAFIKGAACLVRSKASRSWRFLSDIDVIVPHNAIDDAVTLLEQTGYAPNIEQEPIPNSHHIVPFVHPEHAAFIEVHTEPYGLSHYHAPSLPDFWEDIVTIDIDNVSVTVPSITDHIWILMRTDSIPRPYMPRLCDALETTHLMTVPTGEQLQVSRLLARATQDDCPYIVAGMSYACNRFMGYPPFAPDSHAPLKQWEGWTRYIERRYWRGRTDFEVSRNRFAALTFTTDNGLIPKLRYLMRLIKYECNEDRASGTILTHIPPLLVVWRSIKDFTAYAWIMTEYLFLRMTRKI